LEISPNFLLQLITTAAFIAAMMYVAIKTDKKSHKKKPKATIEKPKGPEPKREEVVTVTQIDEEDVRELDVREL
jgi:hypothetical protein